MGFRKFGRSGGSSPRVRIARWLPARRGEVWRRRAVGTALTAALVAALSGCHRPRGEGPPRAGRVDLGALVTLHPAWARVQDLDAKIARLRALTPVEPPR